MTFSQIAKFLKISPMQAFRAYESGIKKLKHPKNKAKWETIFEIQRELEKEKIKNSTRGEKYEND